MSVKLRDKARGRWCGILVDLGIPAALLAGKHGPCPLCGGKDRFRFDDKEGNGTWICSQCGAGDGVQLVMKKHGIDFKTAAGLIEPLIGCMPVVEAKKSITVEEQRAALSRLWRSASDITDRDPVSKFLRSRGLDLDRYPAALQCAPRVRYRDGDNAPVSWHPAMIAALCDVDGKPVNLHRTYLTDDGRKAAVDSVRKMMPGPFPDGAAIRLAEHRDTLGIAEGIETALAVSMLFGIPCWSAVNSSGMAKWQAPADVRHVIVFSDNDPQYGGQAAAYTLAHRLAVKGLTVQVEIPPNVGEDWNDVVLKSARLFVPSARADWKKPTNEVDTTA